MRTPPFSEILHFVEVAAIVITTAFAGYQLRAFRIQSSADLALRLNREFQTDMNEKIMDALDSDPATPILKRLKSGGAFTVTQLEWYLDEYETLDDLYENGLITCHMMYNEFSYDLEKAYKNNDVKREIAEERKDDPTTWQGFSIWENCSTTIITANSTRQKGCPNGAPARRV